MTKYIDALGYYFNGYDSKGKAIYKHYPKEKEYIQGNIRPIFFTGRIKRYSSKNPKEKGMRMGTIRIPATREALRKTAEWNIKYGAEDYQKAGRRLLRKVI
jgi:hypothetical protein